MAECIEELRAKNAHLEKKISELSVENDRIRAEKYSAESALRDVKAEKEKLLQIIENLSKGYANMES